MIRVLNKAINNRRERVNRTNLYIRNLYLAALFVMLPGQLVMAAGPMIGNAAVKFAVATTSAPGLSINPSSRIAWFFDDVTINKDAPISEKEIRELLKTEIGSMMQQKGFEVTKSGSPADYYLAFTAATESTLDEATLLKRYKVSPGFEVSGSNKGIYEKGTLLIHLIDANTRATVWQSAVQAGVQTDIGLEKRRENIRTIVRAMLNKLPIAS